jgi:DNA modification methylase
MLIRADARALPLRDGCVDCCVTSPPYFGLRDYGHAGQIGLEETVDAYVDSMRAVFQSIARVLRPEGTVWLNLGDSYAAGGRGGGGSFMAQRREAAWQKQSKLNGFRIVDGFKQKDLLGIPWRVAFALQADGWYLRSDIIWSKPNPMPESVTDRPTKAHEYLFLLTKSERYFYDAAAIYEPYAESTLREVADGYDGLGLKDYEGAGVQNPSDTKRRIIAGIEARFGGCRNAADGLKSHVNGDRNDGARGNVVLSHPGRNKRTVWTVNTMPYAGAHFATMPEKLVEPCILAGCPLGGLVLDPFVGSGTVVAVAQRLGRRGVGVDLSYQQLAKERTAQRGLIYGEETA